MGAFDYFKNCITKKYADFNGRARRSEYWYFVLFYLIIYFGLIALTMAIPDIGSIITMVFALAMLVPNLAVAVRRMHDVGKSGWFILIPIYNLILTLTDSQPGANEYGPNPKTGESDVTDHLV